VDGETNLDLSLRLLGGLVDGGARAETVLIVPARGAFMLCLARQTVGVATDWAVELIQLVLVDAPAGTVGSTAVEALRLSGLRLLDAQQ